MLSDVDARTSPGDLFISKGRTFTSKADFIEGTIRWNVWIGEEGGVFLNPAVSLTPYAGNVSLRRGIITDAVQDPITGDIWMGTWMDGAVVLRPDGTALTYRTTGVWDTTEDPIGILVSSTPKITHPFILDVWQDVETGDIYLCTNDGGLNILHTQKTWDPGDDTIDVYSEHTTPALLKHDPFGAWKDEDGNIYTGAHNPSGVTVLRPDGTSTSYTPKGVLDTSVAPPMDLSPYDGSPVISDTPRIGGERWDAAYPLFRDEKGDLYVGMDRGLTVLHYDPEVGRYTTSTTYRTTGMWDTTEDPQGTLIRSTPQIGGHFSILHPDDTVTNYTLELTSEKFPLLGRVTGSVPFGWQDGNGDVYLGEKYTWKDTDGNLYVCAIGGLYVIQPDGGVMLYTSHTQIYSLFQEIDQGVTIKGWRDSQGNFYPITDTRAVLPTFGTTKGWNDREGNLYVISGELVRIPHDPRTRVDGTLTGNVVDTRHLPVHSIGWNADVPAGARLVFQTRTGEPESYWMDEFDDGIVQGVSVGQPQKVSRIAEGDGHLMIEDISSDMGIFIHTGKPKDYFPEGSVLRVRLRGIGLGGSRGVAVHAGSLTSADRVFGTLEEGRWLTYTFMSLEAFNRIVLSIPPCKRLEVDWVSVQKPAGWTPWVDAPDPTGSPLLDLGEDHPYLQWRAVFSTENTDVLPALKEVKITTGYPPRATYISPAFDTRGSSVFKTISWDAEVPEGTSLKFQIRTASAQEDLLEALWLGPTADEEFYTASGTTVHPVHRGDRWIQYKVMFETEDETKTPVLKEVRIEYTIAPVEIAETPPSYSTPPGFHPITLQTGPLSFRTKEDWSAWTYPSNIVEITDEGVVLPVFIHKDINAALDAGEFTYGTAGIRGGIRGAGSNPEDAPNLIDGDVSTTWGPDPNSPVEDWWVEVDLGRLVYAMKIVVRFAPEGDVFKSFEVLISDGSETSEGGEELKYVLGGEATEADKSQRMFEFPLSPSVNAENFTGAPVQMVRIVATEREVGSVSRIGEVEVWSLGQNLGLGIADRRGKVEDNGGGRAGDAFDGLFSTGWTAYEWTKFKERGWLTVDLGAAFWVDTICIIGRRTEGTLGLGSRSTLIGYILRGSDGSRTSDGKLIWDTLASRSNNIEKAALFEERFPPRKLRFLDFRNVNLFAAGTARYGEFGIVNEMQVFGDGYVPDVTMISPIVDVSNLADLTSVEWVGDTPPGTEIEIRTRTGDGMEEVKHYFRKSGEEITEQEWEALPSFARGEVKSEFVPGRDWSDWSQIYASEDTFTSPGGKRYIQVQVRLSSDDPQMAPSLDSFILSEESVPTQVLDESNFGNPIPDKCALFQNYPNPFNATTAIRYQLPKAGYVKLSVYNALGQEIRNLVDGHQLAGYYTVNWDGKDDNTTSVGSGVYLYILQAGDVFRETRKMLLIQ